METYFMTLTAITFIYLALSNISVKNRLKCQSDIINELCKSIGIYTVTKMEHEGISQFKRVEGDIKEAREYTDKRIDALQRQTLDQIDANEKLYRLWLEKFTGSKLIHINIYPESISSLKNRIDALCEHLGLAFNRKDKTEFNPFLMTKLNKGKQIKHKKD